MEKRTYPRAIETVESPEAWSRQDFSDARAAVEALKAIYHRNTQFLRDAFMSLGQSGTGDRRFRAFYPEISIVTNSYTQIDSRQAYGHLPTPGFFSTTITRPDLFEDYLIEQLRLIMRNHGMPITVGESRTPIPLHFAFLEGTYVDGAIADRLARPIRDIFDVPDLEGTDDHIANGTFEALPGDARPLAPFTAQRIDYSLHRLSHYTATSPQYFQNYVLFTNYQFYVDEFCVFARDMMVNGTGGYTAFIEPGNVMTPTGESTPQEGATPPRMPQMPAYHLVKPNHGGITMINIGVGPSNAKTITDHVISILPMWISMPAS